MVCAGLTTQQMFMVFGVRYHAKGKDDAWVMKRMKTYRKIAIRNGAVAKK